jgi:ComF family protein
LLCWQCHQFHLKQRRAACFYCNHYGDGRTCSSCRVKTSLDGLHVCYYYEPPLDQLIFQLKYYGNREVGSIFAASLVQNLPSLPNSILTYVPVAGSRRRSRGYNQAELLARSIVQIQNIPLRRALIRTHSVEQIGQGRTQRYNAVVDNFMALGSRVRGENIVVVDDVVTSGATLNECARMLKLAGAKQVWGLALAKK